MARDRPILNAFQCRRPTAGNDSAAFLISTRPFAQFHHFSSSSPSSLVEELELEKSAAALYCVRSSVGSVVDHLRMQLMQDTHVLLTVHPILWLHKNVDPEPRVRK